MDRPKLTHIRKTLRHLDPAVQLDEAVASALRQELERAREALASARTVVTMPRGRYPTIAFPFGTIGYATLLRDTPRLSDLFAYDALVRAQDKDVDGALASCRGILNCGRSLGDEPAVWSMIFRVALNQMAARRVERILAQGEPSGAALSSIQSDLAEEADQPLLLIAARGQRGGIDEMMQAIQDGIFDPNSTRVAATGLNVYNLIHVPGMTKNARGSAAVL